MRLVPALFVLAAAAVAGPINLVQNGDFEIGDLTGWTTNSNLNSDSGAWVWSSNGNAGSSGAVSNGCVGDTCINGDSTQQNFLTQLLATTAGDLYSLSFFYDPGSVTNITDTSELLVQFDGVNVADLVLVGTSTSGGTFTSADLITPGSGYNQYTFTVTASTNSTALNFLGRQDPFSSYLDDIVVTDLGASTVPEPSTYIFGASGLLALAIAKFRRR